MNKVIIIWLSIFVPNIAVNSNEYGYFNVTVLTMKPCQGPKRKDCCTNTLENINGNNAKFELNVKEDVTLMNAKIVASFKGKPMVRLPIKKPCEHFFISPYMSSLFNTTNKCLVMKGHYEFNLAMADIFMKYYKGMFMYGNWTFRAMFWADDCNFFCSVMVYNLYPKDDKNN